MSFILFLIYYFISTILLIVFCFLLWKFKFKKLFSEKLAIKTLNDFFNEDCMSSITDIKIGEEKDNAKEEENKLPTFF